MKMNPDDYYFDSVRIPIRGLRVRLLNAGVYEMLPM